MKEGLSGGPNLIVFARRAAVALGIALLVEGGLRLFGDKHSSLAPPLSGRWRELSEDELAGNTQSTTEPSVPQTDH